MRYERGDLTVLAKRASALGMSAAERKRIYDHFNAHETVGAVVAGAMAAA